MGRVANVIVYRVQDDDGRGPWRPGLSQFWIDESAPVGYLAESVFSLVPLDEIREYRDRYHLGSACRSLSQLMKWFSPVERRRLELMRFFPVQLHADIVIAESDAQLLIGRSRPFTLGATRRSWSDE